MVAIGLSILIFKPNNINNLSLNQPIPSPKLSQKQKSGPNPGACLVLEQKYCGNGKIVEWKNPNGQTLKFVTFTLPEGTLIFSPLDGSASYIDGPGNMIDPKAPGVLIYVQDDPNSVSFTLTGDIKFDKQLFTVKKGDVIATIKNTNIKVFDSTVAVTTTLIEDSKSINNKALYDKLLIKQ